VFRPVLLSRVGIGAVEEAMRVNRGKE
jgi:hypothetical protein